MRLILTLLLGVIAGSAMATDYTDVGNARQAVEELRALQSTRALTDEDIRSVAISVTTKDGPAYSFDFVPTDSGWDALLKGIQTMVGDKIDGIKTQLQDMSVTGVPN